MIKPTYFLLKMKMYLAVNIIYKNIILYNFVIYLLRHINLFLPHENDIYGLRYLKLNRNNKIVDIGAGDGLYFRSVRSIGIKNSLVTKRKRKIYIKKNFSKSKKEKEKNTSALRVTRAETRLTVYRSLYMFFY